MVQSNMVLKPFINYDVIDAVPIEQKIQKTIQIDGQWEDMTFVRIPTYGVERHNRGSSELEIWCYEHYGEPVYLGRWFKISGYIILDDRTYVHWKLCQ